MARYLIVNADDFGLCRSVNQGIIECFEHGIVTSTSLMIRQPAAAEAAAYARQNPRLGVGLHLDLGEWIYRHGDWQPLYQVADILDSGAVKAELNLQVEEFRRLMGRDPDHLDSHQHVHCREPVRAAATALAKTLNLVLRAIHPDVRYCGHFYGQEDDGTPLPEAITLTALEQVFADLPEGITELCCHPGFTGDLKSIYLSQREDEVRVLCHPGARQALVRHEITLCSHQTARQFMTISPHSTRMD